MNNAEQKNQLTGNRAGRNNVRGEKGPDDFLFEGSWDADAGIFEPQTSSASETISTVARSMKGAPPSNEQQPFVRVDNPDDLDIQ